MFSCCQVGGISAGFPDVCKTPVPPVPHPNVGMALMTVPVPVQVLTIGGPKHNMASKKPITLADTAGVGGGLVSQRFAAKHKSLAGAFTYICKGTPTTRVTTFGITNQMNCPDIEAFTVNFKELVLCA
ncbi:PAAR-like domain-containing protein [Pelistega sp. MC2]|uniref:PAAR-like domain-containing protein n=1 Tax=Pelistega sp. MC2 TaxID=1720297 RepID=UPI0008D913B6|nr:PAAR-like domain-containing protein [Pelistega sp. MC2]